MRQDSAGYFFPAAPHREASEWPGDPIGASNVVTRTKGRTKAHDRGVDRQPGKLHKLLASVERHRRANPQEPVWTHDVVIHGIRVRAETNSRHLYGFWVENWYSPEEWLAQTDQPAPDEPQVRVYAYGGVKGEPEAAYYSRRQATIVFFNTSYYGQLKSWVLGAVGRVLAAEYGIHSVHGACVAKDGRGVLYIAPTGTGKSSSAYGFMQFEGSRFHSDDWVYIRYAYPTWEGERIAPTRIRWPGGEVRGYEVFGWLEAQSARHPEAQGARHPEAQVEGLNLQHERRILKVSDLRLDRPPEAYAYISEKVFYIRTNLVENFPQAAAEFLQSNMENVPEVTPEFLQEHRPLLDGLLAKVRESEDRAVTSFFEDHSDDEVRRLLARLFAFDNGRAMFNIGRVFPQEKVYLNPMEPVRLANVFLLQRDHSTDVVLRQLSEGEFVGSLLVGRTPGGKYETAYNAYRAVIDEEERAFIQRLMAASGGENERLYEVYRQAEDKAEDVPESLREEFELFRVLTRSTQSLVLNTILMKDPDITERGQAVAYTMSLIVRAVEEPLQETVDLDNYRAFAPQAART